MSRKEEILSIISEQLWEEVITELLDRNAFDYFWDGCDNETQYEIKEIIKYGMERVLRNYVVEP